jgi:hypothetical protein
MGKTEKFRIDDCRNEIFVSLMGNGRLNKALMETMFLCRKHVRQRASCELLVTLWQRPDIWGTKST